MSTVENRGVPEKRVLIFGNALSTLINFRWALIKELQQNGFEVHAATGDRDPQLEKLLKSEGISFHGLDFDRSGLSVFAQLGALIRVRALLLRLKPHATLAYTLKPILLGSLAQALLPKRGRFIGMFTGLGYLYTGDSVRQRALRSILWLPFHYALRFATWIVFQNADDREIFVSSGLINRERTQLIDGSGVDTRHFPFTPLPKEIIFISVCRLLVSKGVHEYAEAAGLVKAKYPEARFWLLGPLDASNPEGISPETLESWVSSGRVEHLGQTTDVRPYLQAARIFVLASYREGTPRSTLEALSTGRPIITTDAPGCRETVNSPLNGFTVPCRDAKALAEACVYAIENPDWCERAASESRRMAEDRFSMNKINPKMIEWIRGRDELDS